MPQVFVFIGLLIFAAHLFAFIFSRKRVPDVLFLMAIGILVGPVLHLVSFHGGGRYASLFGSLTLLFILFDSGVDMRIDSIRRYWKGVVQVALSSYLISVFTVMSITMALLSFDWLEGCLMGTIVSGTAAAVVIPLVVQMRVSEKTRTTLILESALSGVMSIVFTLALVEALHMGSVNVLSVSARLLYSFIVSSIIGIVGGVVWAGLLEKVRRLKNSMFLTPAFLFLLFGLAEYVGQSGSIAALSFGIVLGNTNYFDFSFLHRYGSFQMVPLSKNEKSFFKEIVFVLKTVFFVYIGICIPFNNVTSLLYGLAIALGLFAVRFLLVFIVGRKNTFNDRLTVSVMIPKGLVSAVLASVPLEINHRLGYQVVPHAAMIASVTYAVIFFSIVLTSLLVLLTSRRLVKDEMVEWKEEYNYE